MEYPKVNTLCLEFERNADPPHPLEIHEFIMCELGVKSEDSVAVSIHRGPWHFRTFVMEKAADELLLSPWAMPMDGLFAEKPWVAAVMTLESDAIPASVPPQNSQSIITQRFGLCHATGVRAVQGVTRAMAQLCPLFIVWPQGEKTDEVTRGFLNTSAFPGTIGAISGTHTQTRAPHKNPEAYINRKGYHSMHLQAFCDHRGIFTHCFVGHVGSLHDARVFRLSRVSDCLGDDLKFPNDSHIIGDSTRRKRSRGYSSGTTLGILLELFYNFWQMRDWCLFLRDVNGEDW
ncbi:putative nuclease HARBI1 [Ischnura elegans]|uniref:putative nuclease HARBI1 n=1 Tax=Ischnura elegans TaxID=197161 RepID=UPI001ED894D4|nr:putative nuclease HARBI1 [Ischnura elegans]